MATRSRGTNYLVLVRTLGDRAYDDVIAMGLAVAHDLSDACANAG